MLRGYFLFAARLTASLQGLFERRAPLTPASSVTVSLGRQSDAISCASEKWKAIGIGIALPLCNMGCTCRTAKNK